MSEWPARIFDVHSHWGTQRGYPFQTPDGFATNLVLRSRDTQALGEAYEAVKAAAGQLVEEGKARGWS